MQGILNPPMKKHTHRHMGRKNLLLLISILVGILSSLAAIILKTSVHYLHYLLENLRDTNYNNYFVILAPAVGTLLSALYLRFFVKGDLGRGAESVLYSISKKHGRIPKSGTYSHIISSALTVGLGGSAGLEAPIVATGSAIGSNFAGFRRLSLKDRYCLIAAGAAAGIASVFNAPIAGVMFAIEVIMPEISVPMLVPVIVSSATGTLLSRIILREDILLFFRLREPFNYLNVPYYLCLGLLTAFFSLYYMRAFAKLKSLINIGGRNIWMKWLAGGTILCLLIYIFPPLFGEGYSSIKTLANGKAMDLLRQSIFPVYNEWMIFIFIALIPLLKAVASCLTLNSGGNGGNFAPSLFCGAFIGYGFSHFINHMGISSLPESNFTIVAMAGVLSGVMYAPLTGIFLIAEITGGYELMIPLMIVSSISYVVIRHFEEYSMDTRSLAKAGLLMNGEKHILNSISIEDLIETDYKAILCDSRVSMLEEIIKNSNKNVFPVIDSKNHFLGIISLEAIRELLFELDDYSEMPVIEMMTQPEAVINAGEEVPLVIEKFDRGSSWELPVIKGSEFLGFISKSGLFSKYRDQMKG